MNADYLKTFVDPKTNNFKIAVGIVVLIVVFIIYRVVRKQIRYNKMNPRFFPKGKDGKVEKVIKNDEIYKSNSSIEYSMFTWLYLNSMSYKYGEWKHILNKGVKNIYDEHHAPGIYLHPTHNIILFRVSTKTETQNIFIDDFPIRKWFSVGIVVGDMKCELYINGRLARTVALRGEPRLNNGDLYVSQNGGFDGAMSSLSVFSYALSAYEVIKRHYGGPYGAGILDNIINYVTGKASAIKSLARLELPKVNKNVVAGLSKPYIKPSPKLRLYTDKMPKFVLDMEKRKESVFVWCSWYW